MNEFTAACVQMRAGIHIKDNIEQILPQIRDAATHGAQYIQTPEMSNILQPDRAQFFEEIKSQEEEPMLRVMCEEAKRLKVYLHLGSLAVRLDKDHAANRGYIISPQGKIIHQYDKIHMFDVQLPSGQRFEESKAYKRGEQAVIADLPFAKIGVSICYDLRFPQLYRELARREATCLAIPSSFTVMTGHAHWHVLMRARAIETGSYVIAAAQGGKHEGGRETFGHSLIIDPWGNILSEAAHAEPAVILAHIRPEIALDTRARMPSLRDVLYNMP